MEPVWIGSAIALAGLVIGWFFRSPKESASELASRLASLESKVGAMAENYAGVHARHDETMRSLTASQTTLTAALDRVTNRLDAVHEALLVLKGMAR